MAWRQPRGPPWRLASVVRSVGRVASVGARSGQAWAVAAAAFGAVSWRRWVVSALLVRSRAASAQAGLCAGGVGGCAGVPGGTDDVLLYPFPAGDPRPASAPGRRGARGAASVDGRGRGRSCGRAASRGVVERSPLGLCARRMAGRGAGVASRGVVGASVGRRVAAIVLRQSRWRRRRVCYGVHRDCCRRVVVRRGVAVRRRRSRWSRRGRRHRAVAGAPV